MTLLETERVLFRDHEPEDLEPFCAMETDPEVRRFVGGRPRTRPAAERKFRDVCLPPVRDRMGLWATVFKPESLYIGYCGIYPHFGAGGAIPGGGRAGVLSRQGLLGRGLATEAGRAFIDFGFEKIKLSRIVATAQIGNEASLRVLQKLGFDWLRLDESERRSFHEFELRNLVTPHQA